MMKKFMRFVHDDNGMEFIQVAVIVLATIALAAVAYALYGKVKTAIEGVNVNIEGTI